MFVKRKLGRQNLLLFFLLIAGFLIGMPTILAFTLGNNLPPEVPVALYRPQLRPGGPLLTFAQRGPTLDIHVLPHDEDSWDLQDDLLLLRLHNAEALPSYRGEGWLDQNVQYKLEDGLFIVVLKVDNLPPVFRIAKRDNRYSIIWSEPGLSGKRIAIDPGHGGHDPGAEGLFLREKDITLAIGLELQQLLQQAGAEVFMTRSTDTLVDTALEPGKHIRPDLWKRQRIVEEWDPDFFISIHNNSWIDRKVGGIETYYNPHSFNRALNCRAAQLIQARLVEAIGRKDRGIRYKENSDAVLQTANYPSALAEILYISNRAEEAILAEPDFPQKAAQGLFLGISDYFSGGEER